MRKLTDEQESELCELYLAGVGCQTLGLRFSVSHVTVLNILERHGIKRGSPARRKHTVNESFFADITNERPAYWLGFIAADGYIFGRTLTIDLATKDRDHLAKFLEHISASYPIRPNHRGAGSNSLKVVITSQTMTDDLARFGIVQRKTASLPWPISLDPDLLRHFVRGYFDGDGGFTFHKGRYNTVPTPSFHIIAHSAFASHLHEFIASQCGLRLTKAIPYGNEMMSVRYCGRRNVKAFCDWLYRDATIYMDRKHDLILPHLDHSRALPSNTKLTPDMISAIQARLEAGESAWHIYASGDFPVGHTAIYKVLHGTTMVGKTLPAPTG